MELFKHQIEGIDFLKESKRAILADEMGLGKTRQAIVAAKESEAKGVLVVCPASLKINWKREIKFVYPDDLVAILSTTDPMSAEDYRSKWFIVNYDILEKKLDLILDLVEREKLDTLILDEAHYIKGKTIRAKCVVGGKLNSMAGKKFEGLATKMEKVYCLTGTPIMNRPIEMFHLLRAISHPLGSNRTTFARRYCDAFLQTVFTRNGPIRFMNEQGSSNTDELRERLKGYLLRRKKKEVLELPEKIVSVMEVELDSEWRKNYETAWESYLEFLRENPMPEKNLDNILQARHLVEIQKLKQVCSKAKVKRIVSDIENAIEQGEKVIVFSQYTETIKSIAELAREIKTESGESDRYGKPILKKAKVVTLTGADDMTERQKAVDAFQTDDSVKVFVANIKAGGVGLTLTEATIVIFADMEWSPETHNQAEDRAHRIGQEGTVNVYYYIAPETIEEDIIDILNSKRHVMDEILEGKDGESSVQKVFLERLRGRIAGS